MDAVITYVDNLDPVWQRQYSDWADEGQLNKRFRDWGTLKYLLRGIEKNMPFVRNVYLVVSTPSQVPEWADRSKLKVVLHSDIIPAEFLPVFNSCAIEMFLHRIPGLDERFIYFNDDMFPLLPCAEEDFFRDGRSVIHFAKHLLSLNMYKRQCRVSSDLARKALGMGPSPVFVRPQHTCSPMLRSRSEEAFEAVREDVFGRISRLRRPDNPNQYMFLDYLYFGGWTVNGRISNAHLSQAVYSGEQIAAFIQSPTEKFACINDVMMPDAKYVQMRESILGAFARRFPEKSRFEL